MSPFSLPVERTIADEFSSVSRSRTPFAADTTYTSPSSQKTAPGTSYTSLSSQKTVSNALTRYQSLRRSVTRTWQPVRHIFQRNEGYHFGVLCATCTIASVFVVNLVLTIWASSRYGVEGGIGTIHEGACSKTKNMATWLHLAINALSTLLLGASNYAMQCLAAPTREDIDKAHKTGHWMDIGVPSMRNLWRISRWRLFLWFLVAFSSIPLHLMYNSAVFSTLSAREYTIFTVTNGFFTGAPYNLTQAAIMPENRYLDLQYSDVPDSYDPDALQNATAQKRDVPDAYDPNAEQNATAQKLLSNTTKLRKLDNKACIEEYSKGIISTRSNLLLVTPHENDTNAVLAMWTYMSPQFSETKWGRYHPPWVCDLPQAPYYPWEPRPSCDVGKIAAKADTWTMGGHPIQYCLSEPVEEHCRLQFSVGIMIIIILCNAIKMVVMGYIAWTQPLNLVTIGDAIASFLDRPDTTTTGSCLAGKEDFQKSWQRMPMRWELKTHHWFRAASKKRWLSCNILWVNSSLCLSSHEILNILRVFLS